MDWKIVRKIARDLFRHERIDYERCDVLTVAHDNDRSFLRDGKYYSPLIDTLEDRLAKTGTSCLSIARIISTIKGPNAYGNVRSPEGAFARALLTKRLKGQTVSRGRYPFSNMEARIWEAILESTGAKFLVGIQPSRELCVVARRRGVWVADMQHGVIADSHPWYGRRFRAHEPPEYLPHAFLCWDPGSAEVLEWVESRGSKVITIGNPWVSRFIAPKADDRIVNDLLIDAGSSFERRGKPNVLVSLSWGETGIPNGLISEEVTSVIRETQADFNWILRLHPNQVKGFASHESRWFLKYFEKTLAGYASWEEATRHPLPLVLSQMDLHVTWSSSVCIEAAHFGIKSALLNPRMRSEGAIGDYYRYYKSQGSIAMIDNSRSAIGEWLTANMNNVKRPEDYAVYDAEFANVVSFLSRQT